MQTPQKTRRKHGKLIVLLLLCITAGALYVTVLQDNPQAPVSKQPTTPSQTTAEAPSFDRKQRSLTDATSLWVIVNKQHPLQPQTYIPADLRLPNVALRIPGAEQMKLRDEAATAIERMFNAAKTAGYDLQITTAYRGYSYQKTLYDGYVADQGQAAADTESARPGYSEHQTGLAADVRPVSGECYLEACFGDMAEGKWVAADAYKYGFIIRYANGKTESTGYNYEPWHLRYVGVDLATELHRLDNPTLEEYFAVSGGTVYN